MKFKDFLQEQKEKHAVMAFGRMNPITVGHEKLVNKVKDIADKVGGSAHIVVSHSQDPKKNPLTSAQKVKHAKRAFPGVNVSASSPDAPNFLAQAAKLHKQGVTHLHMVGGQDRVGEFHKLLHKYNGVKGPHGSFNFKKIEVHSAGDRDPDAEGVEGMSASKMREHASKGNFKKFRSGVPSTMSDQHAKEMYDHVRKGMKIDEDINFDFEELLTEGVNDKSIFKAVFLAGGPGSGKDYVLDNTLAGHGLTEINSDKALEFLMDKEGLDKQMPENEKEARDFVRNRAKNITELKQRLALTGRNGLIVNGTGDDHEKVKRIKTALENLGYDTSMVMVNTNDEVSAQRNIERGQRGGRTVPENIRRQKWEAVQNARPELAKLFGDRYTEFDNSEDLRTAAPEVVKAKKDEMLELYKGVKEFISQPPASPAAEEWIAKEMQSADRLPVPKNGAEMVPHPESGAAEEAREMGLQYYGFGRYGRNGKVTHRSVHDKLVEVQKYQQDTPNLPAPGTSMKKKVNEEFEEVFAEDLRKWFSKTDPAGDWKRINSKGEAIGPCAREPGEPKPKCMSRAKRESLTKKERASAVRAKRKHDPNPERKGEPINVSNYGKGKLSESYSLSDSSALNLLLLGTKIDELDYDNFEEEKKEIKLLKDGSGKVRIFMLRRAAAKEAHTTDGIVMPYKNGYVIKLKEENDHVQSTNQLSEIETKKYRINEGVAELTTGQEYARGEGITGPSNISTQETGISRQKITIGQIRTKQKTKVKESIDKGIEPGLSMATGGENLMRGSTIKNKQIKKPFEETIGAGGEDATSMSDFNDNVLKQRGINIKTFKAKRPIG
jgi:predicted ABC-type ATPase